MLFLRVKYRLLKSVEVFDRFPNGVPTWRDPLKHSLVPIQRLSISLY